VLAEKKTDFLAPTFADCFDHNFLCRCPNVLILFVLDSTLKELYLKW